MSGHTTVVLAKPIDQEGVLYQRRAFSALPLLVRQAQAGRTIHYEQLARELGMPNPRNLNYVLGSIGTSLQNLGQLWGEEIPAIQALVTNKSSGLPGRGFTEFLPDPGAFRRATSAQQHAIHQRITDKVRFYEHWRDVLFTQGTRMWGVEVKSVVSREGDILRGLFQCVKYHALLQTEQAAASNACFVDVYLACEHEFPAKLLGVAHVLGVEVFDRPGMGARQRSTT